MPRSKIFLPDINVWLAAAAGKHVHHATAKQWFTEVERGGAAFCRVTQMGLLRLVTNVAEPESLEPTWKQLTRAVVGGKNLWTDACLTTFAILHGMRLVSFDRRFAKRDGLDFELLS